MIENKSIDKVLLINLDKRSDRLELFKVQAINSNLIYNNYIRMSAIDGETINDEQIASATTEQSYKDIINHRPTKGLYLSHGAVGLALTYKEIFENCKCNTLLLEDDILINKNFDSLLAKAMQDIPNDWDILYLGWYQSPTLKVSPITENIAKISGQINGTQAWIINPISAKKLLELFPLNYQIDTCIYMNKNLIKYSLISPAITRSSSNSDIQTY
jgi:GR25 family glycosyltransferase involved in LPS biosynthesis